MSDHETISRENWQSIEYLVNGECSDDDVRALEEMLRGNPAAQKVMLDYCQLHLDLALEIALEASSDAVIEYIVQTAKPTPISGSSRGVLSRLAALAASLQVSLLWLSVGGLLIICSGFFGWSLRDEKARHADLAIKAQSPMAPAAYLTMSNGCSWDDGLTSISHQVGSVVQAGNELALYEGIAEFRLSSGVELSVEGPASLVIISPTSLVLQYGKLTATVPWRVADFRLLAGACRVTACDAEFGVVMAGVGLEVHSFAGEAILTPSPYSGVSQDPANMLDDDADYGEVGADQFAVVKEGEAATLLSTGEVLKNKSASRNQFAAKLSMEGQLPVTKEYVEKILAAKPVSYWRFESIDDGQVLNEMKEAQPLKVVGNVALAGNARNYSLELGGETNAGHLVSDMPVPLSGTDYTVEIWCKPSHFHRGTLVAMGFEDDRQTLKRVLHHAFFLQTMRNDDRFSAVLRHSIPGSIRFTHRNPPTRDPQTGTSCYSSNLYQLRRWQHVVAAKENGSMRLYINGNRVSQAKDSTEIAKGLRLMIGEALFRRPELGQSRPFFGQLDELSIYNRALSEKEIVTHYQMIDFSTIDDPAKTGDRATTSQGARVELDSGNSPAQATLMSSFNRAHFK